VTTTPTTAILGILLASLLGGCSADGGDDGHDDGQPQAGGGLDGGGQIGVGLSWTEGVFVQPVWDEGQLRLLVANRRAAATSLGVYETAWPAADDHVGDQGPTRGDELLQQTVPAGATATIDGSALLGPSDDLLWVAADDDSLGLIERPQPPLVDGVFPIVSNNPNSPSQVETAFSLLPGPSFEATVTLTRPGLLWLKRASSRVADVVFLAATDASSEEGAVTAITDGFLVVVPHGTSTEAPTRVRLSYSVPQDSMTADALVAFDAGFFCYQPRGTSAATSGCDAGAGLFRFAPAP
jgi:hypothetical protein